MVKYLMGIIYIGNNRLVVGQPDTHGARLVEPAALVGRAVNAAVDALFRFAHHLIGQVDSG